MKASSLIEHLQGLQERFGADTEVAFRFWVDPSTVQQHASAAGYAVTDAQACEAVGLIADAYTDEEVTDDGTAPWIMEALDEVLGVD